MTQAPTQRTEQPSDDAQHVESLESLARRIAHDVGNLVFTIRGNLEMISRAPDTPAGIRQFVDPSLLLANEATQLIVSLTQRLRHGPREVQQVNVNEVLREAAELLRQLAGDGVTVTVQLDEGLWSCQLDPARLKSALLNLISNARDAIQGDGEIRIQSGNILLDGQAALAAGLKSAGHYVALAVADTGVGIAPEARARLFEPFFTTRQGGMGKGIGLSLLSEFVAGVGGSVTVDTAEGAGSMFVMYFPADPTPRSATNRPQTAPPKSKTPP